REDLGAPGHAAYIEPALPNERHDGIGGDGRLGSSANRLGHLVEAATQQMLVDAPGNRGQPEREANEAQVREGVAGLDRLTEAAGVAAVEEDPPARVGIGRCAGLARARRPRKGAARRPAPLERRPSPEPLLQPARTT